MKKLWVSMMACAFMLASSGAIAQTNTKPVEKEKKEAPAPAHKNHKGQKPPMKKEHEKKDADKKEYMKKEGEKKAPEKKAINKKAPEKK